MHINGNKWRAGHTGALRPGLEGIGGGGTWCEKGSCCKGSLQISEGQQCTTCLQNSTKHYKATFRLWNWGLNSRQHSRMKIYLGLMDQTWPDPTEVFQIVFMTHLESWRLKARTSSFSHSVEKVWTKMNWVIASLFLSAGSLIWTLTFP